MVRCGIHWTQLGKVERGQRSLRLEPIMNGTGASANVKATRIAQQWPRPRRRTAEAAPGGRFLGTA